MMIPMQNSAESQADDEGDGDAAADEEESDLAIAVVVQALHGSMFLGRGFFMEELEKRPFKHGGTTSCLSPSAFSCARHMCVSMTEKENGRGRSRGREPLQTLKMERWKTLHTCFQVREGGRKGRGEGRGRRRGNVGKAIREFSGSEARKFTAMSFDILVQEFFITRTSAHVTCCA